MQERTMDEISKRRLASPEELRGWVAVPASRGLALGLALIAALFLLLGWVPAPQAGAAPLTEGEGMESFAADSGFFAARWEHLVVPQVADLAATPVIQAAAEQVNDKKAKKNEETVLALYAAFAVGDLDTILAIIHPDVVWIESEGIPYGGTFIGRDAVFAGVFGKIAEEWDDFTAQVETVFAAEADRVVVLGEDSGTFKATGKSMVAPAASIWTLNKDRQVVRFEQFIDTRAVYEATIP